METGSTPWLEIWKRWPEMQADAFRNWVKGWSQIADWGKKGEKVAMEALPEDLYNQWISYMKDLMEKFPPPLEGLGPETFLKMFSSADIYMQLFAWWMNLFQRFQDVVSGEETMGPEVYEKLFQEWSRGYEEIIKKIFAVAFPQSWQWIAEIYSGEIPRMEAEAVMRFWEPWWEFSQSMLKRWQKGERMTPEQVAGISEEWKRAYERSVGRMLRVPAMGYYREAVEKFDRLLDSLMEFNLVVVDFYASLGSAGDVAIKKLQERLAEMQTSGEGEQLKSFRDLYRLWWQTNEDVYVETFRTEEFSRLLGQLVEKGMEFRSSLQTFIEEIAKDLPFPNRSEMNHLYKTIHELKREVRRQKKELEKLLARQESGEGVG